MKLKRHERLREAIRNVSPGGEQSLAESTHSLKLRPIYINVPLAVHPQRLSIGFTPVDDPKDECY